MRWEEWREANRLRWDERVAHHVGSAFYDVHSFLAGTSTLRDFEPAEMGPIDGADLVHLQCHFGLDTLSWARHHGARVSGLDFSPSAVKEATALAQRADLADVATFVEADVFSAVDVLGEQRFDVVYTGYGALCWLHDLDAWARVVAGLLRPGGWLYLGEFHPFEFVFGDHDLTVSLPYFTPIDDPQRWDDGGTYTGEDVQTLHTVSYEWNHGLGQVVTAVLGAGLTLELLVERDFTLWPRWPFLERQADGTYRLPAGTPSLPLMYSLRARKQR